MERTIADLKESGNSNLVNNLQQVKGMLDLQKEKFANQTLADDPEMLGQIRTASDFHKDSVVPYQDPDHGITQIINGVDADKAVRPLFTDSSPDQFARIFDKLDTKGRDAVKAELIGRTEDSASRMKNFQDLNLPGFARYLENRADQVHTAYGDDSTLEGLTNLIRQCPRAGYQSKLEPLFNINTGPKLIGKSVGGLAGAAMGSTLGPAGSLVGAGVGMAAESGAEMGINRLASAHLTDPKSVTQYIDQNPSQMGQRTPTAPVAYAADEQAPQPRSLGAAAYQPTGGQIYQPQEPMTQGLGSAPYRSPVFQQQTPMDDWRTYRPALDENGKPINVRTQGTQAQMTNGVQGSPITQSASGAKPNTLNNLESAQSTLADVRNQQYQAGNSLKEIQLNNQLANEPLLDYEQQWRDNASHTSELEYPTDWLVNQRAVLGEHLKQLNSGGAWQGADGQPISQVDIRDEQNRTADDLTEIMRELNARQRLRGMSLDEHVSELAEHRKQLDTLEQAGYGEDPRIAQLQSDQAQREKKLPLVAGKINNLLGQIRGQISPTQTPTLGEAGTNSAIGGPGLGGGEGSGTESNVISDPFRNSGLTHAWDPSLWNSSFNPTPETPLGDNVTAVHQIPRPTLSQKPVVPVTTNIFPPRNANTEPMSSRSLLGLGNPIQPPSSSQIEQSNAVARGAGRAIMEGNEYADQTGRSLGAATYDPLRAAQANADAALRGRQNAKSGVIPMGEGENSLGAALNTYNEVSDPFRAGAAELAAAQAKMAKTNGNVSEAVKQAATDALNKNLTNTPPQTQFNKPEQQIPANPNSFTSAIKRAAQRMGILPPDQTVPQTPETGKSESSDMFDLANKAITDNFPDAVASTRGEGSGKSDIQYMTEALNNYKNETVAKQADYAKQIDAAKKLGASQYQIQEMLDAHQVHLKARNDFVKNNLPLARKGDAGFNSAWKARP